MLVPHTVTLDSSADSVCPGDTVVFTCATDTGELIWSVDGNNLVSLNDAQREQSLSIFELNLTSSAGNNLVSTATVRDVHLDHNGTGIFCSDSYNPHISDEKFERVIASLDSNFNFTCICRATISTSQFDLIFHPLLCHHQLGSSIGHTPLCTQLHCHC